MKIFRNNKMDSGFRAVTLALFFWGLYGTSHLYAQQKSEAVNFSQVKITDSFWQPRLKSHVDVTLPACIAQETQRIKNFAVAGGTDTGYKGLVYDDSDLYKMIEGASYSLTNNPNPALEQKLDEIIAKIAHAQRKDGYLMTYFLCGDTSKIFTNMDKHEMYCDGHLIEAGIAYYNATGKRSLLDVSIKYTDKIDRTFGQGKREWVPGHPEIELALVKLYRVTGEKRYLDLSKWLIEQRGHNRADWDDKTYYSDEMPVEQLSKINGHAVRAMYLFTGMADVESATSDTSYLAALNRLWDNVVNCKMYLTGGIGSSQANEGFEDDYVLPNKAAYCETCASVGMVMWNQRMNTLKGDAKYADVMERSMYNGALAGISLHGDRFFYVNPLESDGDHHRKAWYGTACCPSQISRFLPSVGSYIYATSDDALWINLFIGSKTTISLMGNPVSISQDTKYPWDGAVKIHVDPEKPGLFAVKLRFPEWCGKYTLRVNGKKVKATEDLRYIVLKRHWKKGDMIDFNMEMPVKMIAADPRVKDDLGKRAIQRGPLVYCLEECDNKENFNSAKLSDKTKFVTAYEKNLLNGVVTITAGSGNETYKFIPYYSWDNRDAGKMKVWIDYAINPEK
jgi:hypothetical protein